MKSPADRRRDARIPLKVPLVIEGVDMEGNPFKEETYTENVSISGACIITRNRIPNGSKLHISAVRFPFNTTAVVQMVWLDEVDGVLKMGVEFPDPTKNWILR